jgi:Pentose-5-phosphate-3-epimerase
MASLSVSAFAADTAHTARDIRRAQEAGADALHIDVMDGHFVTLMGLSVSWLEAMRQYISVPLDVHLMTVNPERFIPQFALPGVKSMVFHLEGRTRAENRGALALIGKTGIKKGLAVSPATPLEEVRPYLAEMDELLLMSSQPGQPGSKFEPDTMERVRALRHMVEAGDYPLRISVDGGLTEELAHECLDNGADNIIMGRAFFQQSCGEIAYAIHSHTFAALE